MFFGRRFSSWDSLWSVNDIIKEELVWWTSCSLPDLKPVPLEEDHTNMTLSVDSSFFGDGIAHKLSEINDYSNCNKKVSS